MKIVKIMLLIACLGGMKSIVGAEVAKMLAAAFFNAPSYEVVVESIDAMPEEVANPMFLYLYSSGGNGGRVVNDIALKVREDLNTMPNWKDFFVKEVLKRVALEAPQIFINGGLLHWFPHIAQNALQGIADVAKTQAAQTSLQGIADAARAAQWQQRSNMLKKYGPYAAAIIGIPLAAYAANQAGYLNPIKQKIGNWWRGNQPESEIIISPGAPVIKSVPVQSTPSLYNLWGYWPGR